MSLEDKFPKTAQGQAVPADATDIIHDQGGITYPNLHRRIDNEVTPVAEGEVKPDSYAITVSGVNSYRTIKHTTHTDTPTSGEPETEVP